jgi:photosystem II stability/assembly factor-like uncharacterized protein
MRAATTLLAVAAAFAFSPPIDAALPTVCDDAGLRAVQFVDKNEGWAVGDEGLILHSIDGGKNWERQKSGTLASLRAVQFLTPYTGWAAGRVERASGSSGILLKTTDGGMTWAESSAGLLPGLTALDFTDESSGFVCGDGTNAFPSGLFRTSDGGQQWSAINGPREPGWRSAAVAAPNVVAVAGAWGSLGRVEKGEFKACECPPLAGRTVHALAAARRAGASATVFAAGDGGLVMASDDGGGSWRIASTGLPPAVVTSCDFRCVSTFGTHLWVAGRPGSIVAYSPDGGMSWELRKTGLSVPLNGLCMISETVGWAVGELGTILGTRDGGKTWSLLRTGGQRAAVLFAHASPDGVPLAALPGLGARDGYLAAAFTMTSADPATANPNRAAGDLRLAAAVRSAGGTASDTVWGFPFPAHCDGLPAEQLLTYWDTLAGGKAREQWLRQLVLAVRMWRPDVIATDLLSPDAPSAEHVMLYAAREAFKLAAEPTAFPEQIELLGLAPHAPKKLYARFVDDAGAQVKIDAAAFAKELADTPAAIAESGSKLLGRPPESRLAFRLVSHRLDGSERHTAFTDGCNLAHGGTARRAAELPKFTPQYLATMEGVDRARRQIAEMTAPAALEKNGEAAVTAVAEALKTLPDFPAAETLVSAAEACDRAGRWTAARELYLLAANKYPTQPATADACRWLVRYHASSEALRRIELAEQPIYRQASFARVPPGTHEVKGSLVEPPTPGVKARAAAPDTEPDLRVRIADGAPRVKFRSAEAERAWLGTGTEQEARLFATDPSALRDPAVQLALAASRLRLGLSADAEKGLWSVGRGTSPWFDAVAAERWLSDRASTPPKPLATCTRTDARPHLDGKLDDACWQTAKPLVVGTGEQTRTHHTEARFAFDDEFLYVGVTCGHPATEPEAKAARRRRDEDLRGHDRVEILLDLDRDYQTYYRLRIDHRGCVAEDCCGDPTWDPRWFVAVEPTTTGWTAELAIPIATLTGSPPRPKDVWAANVVRVLPGRGVLAWSGPADATPHPEGMGLLEFRAK